MQKKHWRLAATLTLLAAGTCIASIDNIKKNYNKDSINKEFQTTKSHPGYQVSNEPDIDWGPNLDNAKGAPNISLDNAYGNIKNTTGVSSDIKDYAKNAGGHPEWMPIGSTRISFRPATGNAHIGLKCSNLGQVIYTSVSEVKSCREKEDCIRVGNRGEKGWDCTTRTICDHHGYDVNRLQCKR